MGGNTTISPEKIKLLEERMVALGIREGDLEERFVRAQGRGGQKVNKTSSCVHLKHLPTGMEVKCQETRSREANRFFARRLLSDKVEESLLGPDSPQARKARKIRKQKARRSKKARAKTGGGQEGEA
jgi:peptide chain release factor